jgi:hypothetical protein
VFRSVHDPLLQHPDLVEIAARQHVADGLDLIIRGLASKAENQVEGQR